MPKEVREIPIKWRLTGNDGSGSGSEQEFFLYKIEFDYGTE
jgi:hypothetical protein